MTWENKFLLQPIIELPSQACQVDSLRIRVSESPESRAVVCAPSGSAFRFDILARHIPA